MDNFQQEHMICAGFPNVNILQQFLKENKRVKKKIKNIFNIFIGANRQLSR